MATLQLSSELKIVGWAISEKKIWVREGPAKNQISGYISETKSRPHDQFTLDLWPHFSFQASPRLFKSVEQSPRKRCEFSRDRPKSHCFDTISKTGSHRHDPFTLDLWPYFSFQTSPSLSKSIQPAPRNRSRCIVRRWLCHLFGYIFGSLGI